MAPHAANHLHNGLEDEDDSEDDIRSIKSGTPSPDREILTLQRLHKLAYPPLYTSSPWRRAFDFTRKAAIFYQLDDFAGAWPKVTRCLRLMEVPEVGIKAELLIRAIQKKPLHQLWIPFFLDDGFIVRGWKDVSTLTDFLEFADPAKVREQEAAWSTLYQSPEGNWVDRENPPAPPADVQPPPVVVNGTEADVEVKELEAPANDNVSGVPVILQPVEPVRMEIIEPLQQQPAPLPPIAQPLGRRLPFLPLALGVPAGVFSRAELRLRAKSLPCSTYIDVTPNMDAIVTETVANPVVIVESHVPEAPLNGEEDGDEILNVDESDTLVNVDGSDSEESVHDELDNHVKDADAAVEEPGETADNRVDHLDTPETPSEHPEAVGIDVVPVAEHQEAEVVEVVPNGTGGAGVEKEASGAMFCDVCGITLKYLANFKRHLTSKYHRQNLTKKASRETGQEEERAEGTSQQGPGQAMVNNEEAGDVRNHLDLERISLEVAPPINMSALDVMGAQEASEGTSGVEPTPPPEEMAPRRRGRKRGVRKPSAGDVAKPTDLNGDYWKGATVSQYTRKRSRNTANKLDIILNHPMDSPEPPDHTADTTVPNLANVSPEIEPRPPFQRTESRSMGNSEVTLDEGTGKKAKRQRKTDPGFRLTTRRSRSTKTKSPVMEDAPVESNEPEIVVQKITRRRKSAPIAIPADTHPPPVISSAPMVFSVTTEAVNMSDGPKKKLRKQRKRELTGVRSAKEALEREKKKGMLKKRRGMGRAARGRGRAAPARFTAEVSASSMTEDEPPAFVCPECNAGFALGGVMDQHMRDVHKLNLESPQRTVSSAGDDNMLMCQICWKSIPRNRVSKHAKDCILKKVARKIKDFKRGK